MFCYTPVTKEGLADLELLKFEDVAHHIAPEKGLLDLEVSKDYDTMAKNVEETAIMNTGDIENIETSEHKEKYYSFGKVKEDYRRHQAEAAAEFKYMKSGTANAGGIGNALRHVLHHTGGRDGVRIACNIYHKLAQAALDSKHSVHDRGTLTNLFTQIRQRKDPGRANLEQGATRFLDSEEISTLTNLLYYGKRWRGGITNVTNEVAPFSRLLYRGGLLSLYCAAKNQDEKSVATLLADTF